MNTAQAENHSDYEESRAEFESWFRSEDIPEKYRYDMWQSWRACWRSLRPFALAALQERARRLLRASEGLVTAHETFTGWDELHEAWFGLSELTQ